MIQDLQKIQELLTIFETKNHKWALYEAQERVSKLIANRQE